MKIGLISLDERPVNTRYPRMIAEIAGASALLPPLELLSRFRESADCAALADWLRAKAAAMDALVVSIEMLALGGLVPSRINVDDLLAVLARLEVLREVKRAHPHLRIYGFGLITRISANAASVEEPHYWRESGPHIYRYSQAWDEYRWGDGQRPGAPQPNPAHLLDVLRRRKRNHIVNLATIDLLADDVFDCLVISSDDTSEYGFGTREKAWAREWVDRRGGDPRLLMYPGADEVGSALLARALLAARGKVPSFHAHYAIPADAERIAPFEDGPARVTLERQIGAVGGVQASAEAADLIVAVNPPAPSSQRFFNPDYAAGDREYRADALDAFAERIGSWLADRRHVIVADIAYPNGADPVLIEALGRHIQLNGLAAYGAWNTAGNTIGVALAQGVALWLAGDSAANARFLARRFIEDYCFMHLVRPQMAPDPGPYDDAAEAAMIAQVTRELNAAAARLPDFRDWRVSQVRLPWKRSFEVDFELARA